jgi:CheY-like chemotaxis protein
MGAFGVTGKPANDEDLAEVFRRMREQAMSGKRRRRAPAARGGGGASRASSPSFAGAKILIVDDDIRNIYSLTSVLESYDVEVLHAERGRDGILILEQTPGIDVALIDIMMPEMDGYEPCSRSAIDTANFRRAADRGQRQGDEGRPPEVPRRRRSDYIAKPVDVDLLLALLRVWVGKTRSRMGLASASDPDGGRIRS